jgi:hypothetical protein
LRAVETCGFGTKEALQPVIKPRPRLIPRHLWLGLNFSFKVKELALEVGAVRAMRQVCHDGISLRLASLSLHHGAERLGVRAGTSLAAEFLPQLGR